jgi:hypothetical protein
MNPESFFFRQGQVWVRHPARPKFLDVVEIPCAVGKITAKRTRTSLPESLERNRSFAKSTPS